MNTEKCMHFIAPGPIAGAEKVVLTGCHALMQQGMQVTLGVIHETRFPKIGTEFCRAAQDLNIPTVDFYAASAIDFGLKEQLEIFWESYPAGIIHAHGFKAITYCFLTKKTTHKLVVHQHGHTSHTLKVKIYEKLESLLLNRCDRVIPVSLEMSEALKKIGIRPEKICTIQNMVAIKDIEKYPQSPKKERAPIRLIYVGRLGQEKGIDLLIHAFKDVAGLYQLRVLGRGPLEHSLKELCKKLKLTKSIEFVGFQKNVLPFFQEADALIIPSLREGLPMTLLEAMAYGLPIAGTTVGALNSLVTTNGLLTNPGSSEKLASLLKDFAKNFKKFDKIAKEKAPIVMTEYSAKTWATKTLKMYQGL